MIKTALLFVTVLQAHAMLENVIHVRTLLNHFPIYIVTISHALMILIAWVIHFMMENAILVIKSTIIRSVMVNLALLIQTVQNDLLWGKCATCSTLITGELCDKLSCKKDNECMSKTCVGGFYTMFSNSANLSRSLYCNALSYSYDDDCASWTCFIYNVQLVTMVRLEENVMAKLVHQTLTVFLKLVQLVCALLVIIQKRKNNAGIYLVM